MSSRSRAHISATVGQGPPQRLDNLGRTMQPGHRLMVLPDPQQAWQLLLHCVATAQQTIDIQLYMLVDDGLGQQFIQALVAARRRGVAVRLMLDGIGSLDLPYQALAEFLEVGGEFRLFGPIWLTAPWRHWTRRNHRKVFVFDGDSAIVTGRNVGDHYYLGENGGGGGPKVWLDFGAWVQGPAVARLVAGGIPDEVTK